MAKADVINIQGEKVGEVELNESIWGDDVKPYLMHDVVVMQLNNRRRGTSSAKTRGEVPGAEGSRGSRRVRAAQELEAPPLRCGSAAVRLSVRNRRNTTCRVPKKVKKAALRSALSARDTRDRAEDPG